MPSLTFKKFSVINHKRCSRWLGRPGQDSWPLSDWAIAAAGEMGKVCNVVTKINRARVGNRKTQAELELDLADEIADTVTYLFLLADVANIDMEQALVHKFNEVSKKHEFPERL